MLSLIVLIAALVLFIVAAFPVRSRVNLVALGLACLVLGAFILPRIGA